MGLGIYEMKPLHLRTRGLRRNKKASKSLKFSDKTKENMYNITNEWYNGAENYTNAFQKLRQKMNFIKTQGKT